MQRENALPIVSAEKAASVRIYASSVGQKLLVGAAGLFLCSFLVVHLSGNLLLFKNDGGKAYDEYSHFMSTNEVIRVLEIVLFAGFVIHIIFGVSTWISNRLARPKRYRVKASSENSTLSSRTSFITGSVVFIFLVIHLRSFWVPTRFASGPEPSAYEMVRAAFMYKSYDAIYLVALAFLGYHLRQGFQSAFQTLGLRPGHTKLIDWVGVIFWLLIPIGFAAMPLYFLWAHSRGVN